MKLEFSQQIFENIQISNFIKFLPVGVVLFRADIRTRLKKLTVAFRNFASPFKKYCAMQYFSHPNFNTSFNK
jgi:hypothetical protein